ncbi:MAG: homoserine kinase [Chloroflexi bacterium]|nr:homoserine kinase [Chloroflexota bacterium]
MSGAPRSEEKSVHVRVPATTANLGPGFDALGLALELHDEVVLRRRPRGATAPVIRVTGIAAGRLPEDPRNLLAYRAAAAVYRPLRRRPPWLELDLHTRIPRSGGLGGSAAAIVAGAVAANELEGRPFSQQELLELAAELEGHPDNVAPALLGGLVICVHGRRGLIAKRLEPPRELLAVVCVPEHAISTKHARDVIPQTVPREDAVFNLGRTALLIAALQTRDWEVLADAMDDRLHQPPRGRLYHALYPTVEAALGAGAHGAALSGSGAAIIALATDRVDEVGTAMSAAAAAQGFPNHVEVLRLASAGATVLQP